MQGKTTKVIRDLSGKPFSKWKPSDKFRYHLAVTPIWRHCVEEHCFHEVRKWRLDFAWPDVLVGVEIDGFGFGHQAQQQMAADNDKQNAAVLLGWRVLRFNSRQLGSYRGVRDAVELTEMVICEAN